MRNCLLALLLCTIFISESTSSASYNYQALADLDGNAATGCSVDGSGAPAGAHELRLVAVADRAQVSQVVLQTCRDGAWQTEAHEANAQTHGAGVGIDGSDRVAWSVPRDWFAGYPRLSLQWLAEGVDTGAVDRLATGAQWLSLNLVLGDEVPAVPALGLAGSLLLLAAILWFGPRHLRQDGARTWIWPVLALAVIGQGWLHHQAWAADSRTPDAIAVDPGNDVTDAGSDILQVRISTDDFRVHFEVDVNDIEAAGLADDARVLFIGNSLTYSNDLPKMLQALAAQAGKRLTADEITLPGAALEDHFRGRTAHAALANGGYQLVIMQQGPSSLPQSQANLLEWTVRFASRIRASGARPALYMVWPDITRIAFFDDVRNSYLNAALEVDGMFIPAGEAWRAAWRSDPALPLYDADQFHPSSLGSYAAALSMFAELYRQSPVGLPPRLTLDEGQVLVFDPDQARRVQDAAWLAHREHGRAGE